MSAPTKQPSTIIWLALLWVGFIPANAKDVEIPCTTWYQGHISNCEVAVLGEVVSVTSHVDQSPAQVLLKESCLIRVERLIGSSSELQQVATIKLVANHIYDTYQQLEPDWGLYRQLRPGQKVLALIHRYENDVAIGSEAMLALTDDTKHLPQILERIQFDPAKLTDADLAVWKVASPRMHQDLAERVAFVRKIENTAAMAKIQWTMLGCLGLLLGLVTIWSFKKLRRNK